MERITEDGVRGTEEGVRGAKDRVVNVAQK